MEIRIGVQNVSRELVVETDKSADDIAALVAAASTSGTLDLLDAKGKRVVVPVAAIGYVEMGEESKRKVGFGV